MGPTIEVKHNESRDLQLLDVANRFQSRLDIEFEITNPTGATGDIRDLDIGISFHQLEQTLQPVFNELISSYNGLNRNSGDPYQREIVTVNMVSGYVREAPPSPPASGIGSLSGSGNGRRELDQYDQDHQDHLQYEHHRELQIFSMRIILEASGKCNGCASDARLTNQVTTGGGGGNGTGGNGGTGGGGGNPGQGNGGVGNGGMGNQGPNGQNGVNTGNDGVNGGGSGGGSRERRRRLSYRSHTVRGSASDETSLTFASAAATRQLKDDKEKSKDTLVPSLSPTSSPTLNPTSLPTSPPTSLPTSIPTSLPTSNPTSNPTVQPTSNPTMLPTFLPTSRPTSPPTSLPTLTPTSPPTPFTLPSAEEVRVAYSNAVMALNDPFVQDVSALQEIPFVCPGSPNGTGGVGQTVLSQTILDRCDLSSSQGGSSGGFLRLNIDQGGAGPYCITAASTNPNANLLLELCDFDVPSQFNDQSWIYDTTANGGGRFRSTMYPDRCIRVGLGEDLYDGIHSRLGTCDDETIPFTTFEFDFESSFLRILDNSNTANQETDTGFCITNRGFTADSGDNIPGITCPNPGTRSDFEWLFLFP